MARKKVKLAWIANDSARRATFKKRKKGLIKKVSELSTLCGVNACAIVYSPYDPQPEVWPPITTAVSPHQNEALRVLTRFNSLPEMEQSKKMMNQEGYMRGRITKLKEQLKKQQRENRENEITHLMYQFLSGKQGLYDLGISVSDFTDLGWLLEGKIKGIQQRIELLNKNKKKQAMVVNEHHHSKSVRSFDQHDENIIKSTTSTTSTITNPEEHHKGTNNIGHDLYHEDRDNKTTMMMMMGLDVAMEDLKRQSWFMEVMNNPSVLQDHVMLTPAQQHQQHQQQVQQHQHQQYHMGCGVGGGGGGGGGEQHRDEAVPTMPSFYGDISTSSWSTAFFP